MRKRLPTEAEWEKAATGPTGYKWSFGNDFDGARLNYCDKQCDFQWKDEKADDGYRWTAPVGRYPEEGYGLYDMSGNVWEWVEDWYDEQFYSTDKVKEPDPVNTTEGKEGRRVGRGGGGSAPPKKKKKKKRHAPANRNANLGFRCAMSAQGF